MVHINEQELFERLKNGDYQAFKSLFHQFYPQLCVYADYYLQSSACAEELVSDLFLKIWTDRSKLEVANIRSYLYRATKNRSLNLLQKKGLATHLLRDDIEIPCGETESPLSRLLMKESHLKMNQLISQLPPRRRLIFTMSRVDGLPFKEIAALLDISIRTVEDQVFKAVKALKEAYHSS